MLDSERVADVFCASRSIRRKAWEKRVEGKADAPEGVEGFVADLAAARGISDIDGYFNPRLAGVMPRPERLRDLPEAAARLADAVEAGERIAILGDYDVDGASSTAIMLRTLAGVGSGEVSWRIPGRLEDGYGPNERLVAELCGDGKASLLLTLDSGTAAVGPLRLARDLGADVIVADHHDAGRELPDALVVNPKRPDEDGSLAHLCAAGLTFLLAVALVSTLRGRGWFSARGVREPDLKPLLGLVGLATVADVVPLVGLNRSYVALGMRRIPEITGLRALMAATGESRPSPHGCAFVLGPCLNAAGRIADMAASVELLVTEDEARAAQISKELSDLNRERRAIQVAAVDQAISMVDRDGNGPVVLYDESWHPGIVGLVAAKVREAFDRPAVIVGSGGRGSARSVDGFDVGAAVIAATEAGLLLKGGGHAMAAGFTADPSRLEAFREHMGSAMSGFVAPPVVVDLVAEPGEALPGHVWALAAMEPFGMGNVRPRVALTGGFVKRVQVIKDKHVKAWIRGRDGETTVMAFNGVGTRVGEGLRAAEGRFADVLGTLDVNAFRGEENAYLKAEDVMVGDEIARARTAA